MTFDKYQIVKDIYDFVFGCLDQGENRGFILSKPFGSLVLKDLFIEIDKSGLEDMDTLNFAFK